MRPALIQVAEQHPPGPGVAHLQRKYAAEELRHLLALPLLVRARGLCVALPLHEAHVQVTRGPRDVLRSA